MKPGRSTIRGGIALLSACLLAISVSGSGAESSRAAKNHWAWKQAKDISLPQLDSAGETWARNGIDRFIYTALAENNISPSPPADRLTLVRRAFHTLTGLPPTAEQVDQFVNDSDPEAFAKLVDRLLASPQYGERWARHWLDVARYADTKGYVFQEERKYPFSYTYRDWVIDAFNRDLPYDQFLKCQIAADHLIEKNLARTEDLAAMGFLTLGRRFLNKEPDIIDDRIDVVTRGTMALTVGCARCHHHKYDPIPTEDYYSLYGVFASSTEPKEKPLLGEPKPSAAYDKYKAKLTELENAIENHKTKFKRHHSSAGKLRDYFIAYRDARSMSDDELRKYTAKRKLNTKIFKNWKTFIDGDLKDEEKSLFVSMDRLAAISAEGYADTAQAVIKELVETETGNAAVLLNFRETKPANFEDTARIFADLLVSAMAMDETGKEALHALWSDPAAPIGIPVANVEQVYNRDDRNEINKLRNRVKKHIATSPGAPPRGMILKDRPVPVEPVVFERGNSRRRGKQIPRQFLEVLSGDDRKPFPNGSGRLDLANAIASPSNPLTARVMVNRIWRQHFGEGLVTTPSDFGTRSDPPSHPELLDFLANQLIENRWSIKAMHRMILLSATFQQASDDRPEARAIDPANRLLWRMNRRRLDFEAMRDSMLFVTGSLDSTIGGQPVDILKKPFSGRRTIYGFIDRQNLPSLHRTFDFASPDQHSPGRFFTTVPQQALYMMNSPFAEHCAEAGTEAPEFKSANTDNDRITWLYRRIFGRNPEDGERELATAYLFSNKRASGHEAADAWTSYIQALLSSNEFIFVD